MKLSDAWQIAERIAADAEAQGFDNTAEAMRQVLSEMALIERTPGIKRASEATFLAEGAVPLD